MIAEIKQIKLYEQYAIKSEKPRKPIEPILFIQEQIVLTRGNFSIVSGPAKSRKTFFITAIVSALATGNWCGVITSNFIGKIGWFDTEQAEADAGVVFDRICKMSNRVNAIDMFYLRGLDCSKMVEVIQNYIEVEKPEFVVIDGIGDLMKNPNDIEESTRIRDWLMNVTQEKNIHILMALHVNYDSPKLRGHLGSELERKSEHVFSVQKESDRTSVKGRLNRRKEYSDFTFEIIDGIPYTDFYIPKEKEVSNVQMPNYYEKDDSGLPF